MLQITEINGVFVTECGRVFRECTYSLRGQKNKLYKCIAIKRKRYDVHRLVAEAFLPKIKKKPWVLHYDDNSQNNHVKNLRWGTPFENAIDTFRNARKTHSKNVPPTEKEMNIFKMWNEFGMRQKDIAAKMNISPSRISQIICKLKRLLLSDIY